MIRFVIPIILIGISVVSFFVFTNPLYKDIGQLRAQVASYDEALGNSKALENERDKLTTKKNAIDPNNLVKINRLLPDNVDNIRLILEIEQIALPYGMVLKDVKYNTTSEKDTSAKGSVSATTGIQGGGSGMAQASRKDYGIWDLSFSTTGTYSNFLNFVRDLENNLRIVDVSSIQFSSSTGNTGNSATGSSPLESYKYDFKIKTYWLKN